MPSGRHPQLNERCPAVLYTYLFAEMCRECVKEGFPNRVGTVHLSVYVCGLLALSVRLPACLSCLSVCLSVCLDHLLPTHSTIQALKVQTQQCYALL